MKWLEIKIFTDRQAEEMIAQVLLDVGAQGVNVEGADVAEVMQWDYLPTGGLEKKPFSVSAYFPVDGSEKTVIDQVKARMESLRTMDLHVPLGSLELEVTELDEVEWENAWKEHFKPAKISDHVVIKPTWEEYVAADDELVVEIDPGMAFGTGSHETTRMCVQLLEEFVEPGKTELIDVGCGSGILSIVGAALGAKKVIALDYDPVAVDVANANIQLNGLGDVVCAKQSDLLGALDDGTKADIIVANIIADIVIRLAGEVKRNMKKNGMFICSGIIESRLSDVTDALKNAGYRIIRITEEGEWRAIACKYKT